MRVTQDTKRTLLLAAEDCQSVYDLPDVIENTTDIGIKFFTRGENHLVIAFRGTLPGDKKNLWEDLDLLLVPWRGLTVHQGFSRCVEACLPILEKEISSFSTPGQSSLTIQLVGHSLGAGVASLMMWALIDEMIVQDDQLSVVALESPRTMSSRSARLFNRYHRHQTIRTRNNQDAITHVPPVGLDYHHVGTLVQLGDPWNLCRSVRVDSPTWSHLLPNVKSSILNL